MSALLAAYCSVAFAFSAWQAWRGYQLQARSEHAQKLFETDPWKARLLYSLADAFTHGLLAVAGWCALWLGFACFSLLKESEAASVGAVALVVALGGFGLLGVTGQVPTILNRLGKP